MDRGEPELKSKDRRSDGEQNSASAVERGLGLLKRKPGGKSFHEEWTEHKREERELEDK